MIEILFCTFFAESKQIICHILRVQREIPDSIFLRVYSRPRNRHNILLLVVSKTRGHQGLYFDSIVATKFFLEIFQRITRFVLPICVFS